MSALKVALVDDIGTRTRYGQPLRLSEVTAEETSGTCRPL